MSRLCIFTFCKTYAIIYLNIIDRCAYSARLDGAHLTYLEGSFVTTQHPALRSLGTTTQRGWRSVKTWYAKEFPKLPDNNTRLTDELKKMAHHSAMWVLTFVARFLVAAIIALGSFFGGLVGHNPFGWWLWWLPIGIVIAFVGHYVFYGRHQSIKDYTLARWVTALVSIAALVIVPLVVVYFTSLHTEVWKFLVGNKFSHQEGLGGWGALIVIVFGLVAVVSVVQLYKAVALARPGRGWVIWLALALVCLLPSMGMSILVTNGLI